MEQERKQPPWPEELGKLLRGHFELGIEEWAKFKPEQEGGGHLR